MQILQNQSIEELAHEASMSADPNITRLGQAIIDHIEDNIETIRDLRQQVSELETDCVNAEEILNRVRAALSD